MLFYFRIVSRIERFQDEYWIMAYRVKRLIWSLHLKFFLSSFPLLLLFWLFVHCVYCFDSVFSLELNEDAFEIFSFFFSSLFVCYTFIALLFYFSSLSKMNYWLITWRIKKLIWSLHLEVFLLLFFSFRPMCYVFIALWFHFHIGSKISIGLWPKAGSMEI